MKSAMAQAYRSIFRAGLFEGKVAVVTGGGTGIGLQIATELLELSGTVVICSRSETKLAAAAEQLKPLAAFGGRIEYLPCNIRQEEDVERTFTRVVEMCGGLDILVNTVGDNFQSCSHHVRERVESGLTNLTHFCVVALHMQLDGRSWRCGYVADMWKGFLKEYRRGPCGCREFPSHWPSNGPCRVRVNCVAPGIVYSAESNYASVPGGKVALTGQWPKILAKRVARSRRSAPLSVSASPAAAYITGDVVSMAGRVFTGANA